jgi:hypothetical protein
MADFKTAAMRLSAHFAGGPAHTAEEDFKTVRDGLDAFLLSRFEALGADELLDLVDGAITALLEQSQELGKPLDHAGAWLFRVAGNAAIDRLRRTHDFSMLADPPRDDDALAALLDRDASGRSVKAALAHAVRLGDHLCVRVITEWLDIAEELGDAPASRTVAERVGCSHTTVNDAKARFAEYLGAAGDLT